MWIEILPRIVGAVALPVGLWLLVDAFLPERPPAVERRRRPRAPRSRVGQALFALGVLVLAGTLAVGESWHDATRGVIVASVFLVAGVAFDARHLAGFLAGSSRARRQRDDPPEPEERAPAARGRRPRRSARRGRTSDDPGLSWPFDSED